MSSVSKMLCTAASAIVLSGCAHLTETSAALSYCDLFVEVQSGTVNRDSWQRETYSRFMKTHGSKGSAWLDQQGNLSPQERIAALEAALPSAEAPRCATLIEFYQVGGHE